MKKEAFVVDFALGDLIRILRDAGFSWSEGRREWSEEDLARVRYKYGLKYAGTYKTASLKNATKVLMALCLDCIQDNPPEEEV